MEFVAGPTLRQLLDESPAGLGTQKAAFFLREIAKGLTFLHDCGIVHRDLKPANIFYENGYVKIGDYGLSNTPITTPTRAWRPTRGSRPRPARSRAQDTERLRPPSPHVGLRADVRQPAEEAPDD